MIATTSPILVDGFTSAQIADEINAQFAAGTATHVNGRRVVSSYGRPPATAWQNGTVSVTVEGRSTRATGTVYAKVGETLELTGPAPAAELPAYASLITRELVRVMADDDQRAVVYGYAAAVAQADNAQLVAWGALHEAELAAGRSVPQNGVLLSVVTDEMAHRNG